MSGSAESILKDIRLYTRNSYTVTEVVIPLRRIPMLTCSEWLDLNQPILRVARNKRSGMQAKPSD